MASGRPIVSVITVVKNGARHIERAIKSVLSQTYPAIEYVIKDGLSTDGTVEILERYRDGISRFESSPDSGISDAWNRALELVHGSYVALLNADDEFEPDLVRRAVEALERTGADLAFCDVELGSESARGRRIHAIWNPNRLWQGTGFLHPGVVARRDAYLRFGTFRLDLRYAMDADWILRVHRLGGRFVKYDSVCRMSLGGLSHRRWLEARREYLVALRENGLSRWQQGLARVWLGALRIKKRLTT